jgi:hypothetical protein
MSRTDIPDWVRTACNRWGRQKRRIWQGKEIYSTAGKNGVHVDGYAESFMGRIQDERVAAGQPGASNQHWDEVFWGDSLDVQRAIVGMPEPTYDALHVKYVWDPEFNLTWAARAQLIGMKERVFWESVGRAEFWVYARLDPTAKPDLPLRRESGQIRAITATLKKVSPPSIDLSALARAKLTLSR